MDSRMGADNQVNTLVNAWQTELGMTRAGVASLAGISKQLIHRWCSGHWGVDLNKLAKRTPNTPEAKDFLLDLKGILVPGEEPVTEMGRRTKDVYR